MSLAAAYRQKNDAGRRGYNHLASLESARNAQNANIKHTKAKNKVSGAVSGATMGAQIGGPWGALAGALGLLFG